jgi:hypothetical protein
VVQNNKKLVVYLIWKSTPINFQAGINQIKEILIFPRSRIISMSREPSVGYSVIKDATVISGQCCIITISTMLLLNPHALAGTTKKMKESFILL